MTEQQLVDDIETQIRKKIYYEQLMDGIIELHKNVPLKESTLLDLRDTISLVTASYQTRIKDYINIIKQKT